MEFFENPNFNTARHTHAAGELRGRTRQFARTVPREDARPRPPVQGHTNEGGGDEADTGVGEPGRRRADTEGLRREWGVGDVPIVRGSREGYTHRVAEAQEGELGRVQAGDIGGSIVDREVRCMILNFA